MTDNIKLTTTNDLTTDEAEPRRVFLNWLLTPVSRRKPKTQAELSTILGISEATLSRWKADPEFSDVIPDVARRRALIHASAVLEKLAQKAKGGNLSAAELYIKFVLRLTEPRDVPAPVDNRVQILIGGKPADSLPVGLIHRQGSKTN